MNILFNGLEGDMFDNVISCKTAKEVWDTLQVICEGTEQVRDNKMQLLIQQYEYFHCEDKESLSSTYSRFQKLLNKLKIHGRSYEVKDSNLKFLRALPKEWKPITVSLRNSHDYKEYTLDKLYGVLKTYELEMEQDEKLDKGKAKGGSMALVAEPEEIKEPRKNEAVKVAPSVSTSEGKGKEHMVEVDDDDEETDEIDEHLAFLWRRFAKLKFKKNFGSAKPSRNIVEKSKFKCFKCGLTGHFASDCRKAAPEKKRFEPIDYKKKYFELLKQQKEKAFITQERD